MPRRKRPEQIPDPAALVHRQAHNVLASLLDALELASRRLASAAAGNPVFTSDHDLKATVELLRILPHLLKNLPPPPLSPRATQPLPLIPRCPICRHGPGAHWPEDCPRRNPQQNPTST